MTTKIGYSYVVNIEANTGATNGEPFLEQAQRELKVWGGMSSSIAVVNEAGDVSISFDPNTATDGPAGVLRWLDNLNVEYTARFMRWRD